MPSRAARSVFNARAKDVHRDRYLLAGLGALVTILDPTGLYSRGRMQPFVRKCRLRRHSRFFLGNALIF
jgi:hypothetical protein